MVFSSQIFLFVFLPVVFLLYTLIPNLKIKNIFLITASLLFYAYGEPYAVILMLVSVLFNHFCALAISKSDKPKRILIPNVIYNIGILFVFKYLSWIVNTVTSRNTLNIALPIGISFFTFQMMSYVIDVYRNPEIVQKNPLNTMLYISFFPQLIAGPIVKYHDIAKQIESRRQSADKIIAGIKRFILGLFKKAVLSDTLAVIADTAFNAENKTELSALTVAVCSLCYALQIYFDFSGYSEMAIGMGKMFGFDFLENFRYPYTAASMKDFWRRWHISLSTWFKEYVYIPLGGNRKGKLRTCLNKGIVFALTGIWHGANLTFLIWGLIHGFFLLLEETKFGKFIQKHKIFAHIYVLLVVIFSFVIFRADSISEALLLMKQLFVGYGSVYAESTALLAQLCSPYCLFILLFSLFCSTPIFKHLFSKMKTKLPKLTKAVSYPVYLLLFIFSLMTVITSNYSPFIYFQF